MFRYPPIVLILLFGYAFPLDFPRKPIDRALVLIDV